MSKVDSSSKIPFGLRDGILYDPSQVKRGLACNCICPSCKKPLVARKGEEYKHHFSHGPNTLCSAGKETSIHLAAKQIIAKNKSLYLPPIKLGRTLREYGIVRFDEVVLEKAIKNSENLKSSLIPDITATINSGKSNRKELYIEIAVTHFLENQKIEELKKNKLSTVEIDLNHLLKEDNVNFLTIENIIATGEKTTWIYNQREDEEAIAVREREDREARRRKKIIKEANRIIDRDHNETRKNRAYSEERERELLSYAKRLPSINHYGDLPSFITSNSGIDRLYDADGRLIRLLIYEHFILDTENHYTHERFDEKDIFDYLESEKRFYLKDIFNDWSALIRDNNITSSELNKYGIKPPIFYPKYILSGFLDSLCNAKMLERRGYYLYKISGSGSGNTRHGIRCAKCGSLRIGNSNYCFSCWNFY